MTDIRLCKDCRWAHVLDPKMELRHQYWMCDHPTATIAGKIDPVIGTVEPPTQAGCGIVRSLTRGVQGQEWCGPEGRFWEPRSRILTELVHEPVGFT